MKKIIILALLTFLLSSCLSNPKDVEQAKKDLWVIESSSSEVDEWSNIIATEDFQLDEKKDIELNYLDQNKFIELDEINYDNFLKWSAKITWKTLTNVDKIDVLFSNKESGLPDDPFTLKQFKSGDSSFSYNASRKYDVIWDWENKYIFTAYSWNEKSSLELIIRIPKGEELTFSWTTESWSLEAKDIIIDIKEVEKKLGENNEFGYIQKISDTSFTYSDIKWLEIKQKESLNVTCENITEFLSSNLKTYFYWNTCRDIVDGKWISVYVVRLSNENYIYEKHYINSSENLYWVYEIEKWIWVTKENLADKNNELKAKNEWNVWITVTDNLFRKIGN